MYAQHRAGPSRIVELLDNLKAEFESLAHDVNLYKMQRDDYERKLQAQLTELNNIQTSLYELERGYGKIKQQYEDEISRLRRQLEIQQPGASGQQTSFRQETRPGSDKPGINLPPPSQFQQFPALSSSGGLSMDGQTPGSGGPTGPGGSYPTPPSKRPRIEDSSIFTSSNQLPSIGQLAETAMQVKPAKIDKPEGPSSLPGGSGFQLPSFSQSGPTSSPMPQGRPQQLPPPSQQPQQQPPSQQQQQQQQMYQNQPSPIQRIAAQPPKSGPISGPVSGSMMPSSMGPPQIQSVLPKEPIKIPSDSPIHQAHPQLAPQQTHMPPGGPPQSSQSISASMQQPHQIGSSAASIPQQVGSPGSSEQTRRQFELPPPGTHDLDWVVGYNPNVSTTLNVELAHNLEHTSVVCCVKFSNDGRYLATGCSRSAQIFDVNSGEKLNVFSADNGKEGDLYIRSVCFSPNGKILACGAEDKTIKLWDVERGSLKETFVGHEMDIYSLDFSPDGKFLVSGSGDKKVKIWDVETGKCLFTLGNDQVGPKDGVTSVAISPDGRLVAAGSLDRVVRLWDAHSGYFVERYEGHMDSVYSVAFSPDGKTLASGSLDKTLKLWELAGSRSRSRCRSTLLGHSNYVLSVAFSPDGNWLISGSKDRTVQFWDPRSTMAHIMLQGHKNSVISVGFNPANQTFATGSGDFRARVWRYKSNPGAQ